MVEEQRYPHRFQDIKALRGTKEQINTLGREWKPFFVGPELACVLGKAHFKQELKNAIMSKQSIPLHKLPGHRQAKEILGDL